LVEAVAVDLLAVLLFGAGAGAAKDATASAIISKAVFMLILPRGFVLLPLSSSSCGFARKNHIACPGYDTPSIGMRHD